MASRLMNWMSSTAVDVYHAITSHLTHEKDYKCRQKPDVMSSRAMGV